MSKMTWVMDPLPEELAIVKWGLRSSEVCAEKVRIFFNKSQLSSSTENLAWSFPFVFVLILLFNLFLLLFINFTVLFSIIYKYHYIISTNFYLYL